MARKFALDTVNACVSPIIDMAKGNAAAKGVPFGPEQQARLRKLITLARVTLPRDKVGDNASDHEHKDNQYRGCIVGWCVSRGWRYGITSDQEGNDYFTLYKGDSVLFASPSEEAVHSFIHGVDIAIATIAESVVRTAIDSVSDEGN